MRIVLVLFFVNVLFLGCQRSNAIEREENKLILEGLFFFNSLEELEEKYGKSNVHDKKLDHMFRTLSSLENLYKQCDIEYKRRLTSSIFPNKLVY
jgi:hypothetical protein